MKAQDTIDRLKQSCFPQPIILSKVSDLKALCQSEEKPNVPVYLKLAHYLKTRRQQVGLLKSLQQEYPVHYYRTASRKMYSIKFI